MQHEQPLAVWAVQLAGSWRREDPEMVERYTLFVPLSDGGRRGPVDWAEIANRFGLHLIGQRRLQATVEADQSAIDRVQAECSGIRASRETSYHKLLA
jgi:hypothetical protein